MAVSSAPAARALASDAFELVVLDPTLPDGNGLDFCRDLRGKGDATAVLMLTARGDDVDRVVGREGGSGDRPDGVPRQAVQLPRAHCPVHAMLRPPGAGPGHGAGRHPSRRRQPFSLAVARSIHGWSLAGSACPAGTWPERWPIQETLKVRISYRHAALPYSN
jgi:CheY-like chemotaxis protein